MDQEPQSTTCNPLNKGQSILFTVSAQLLSHSLEEYSFHTEIYIVSKYPLPTVCFVVSSLYNKHSRVLIRNIASENMLTSTHQIPFLQLLKGLRLKCL